MTRTAQSALIKLFGIIVAACLAVTLCPLPQDTAWAWQATGQLKGYKAYLINPKTGDITFFGTMDDAWTNATALDEFTIGLLDDLHLYREWGMSLSKKVTIELNGHKLFKENNKNHKGDGAIISIKNVDLKIYGGRQNWAFDGQGPVGGKAKVKMPSDSADRVAGTYFDENGLAQASGTASSNKIWNMAYYDMEKGKVKLSKNEHAVSGGLITGGWKTDGGGVEMLGKDSLSLYDTTMAGNIGDNNGGAIAVKGDYSKIALTDSRIAFNWARCDNGGGIWVLGNYCKINMVRSHIDYNIGNDLGGGIMVRGTDCVVTGDAKAVEPSDAAYPAHWASGTFTDHPYAKMSAKQNPLWGRVDNASSMHVGTAGKVSTIAYNIMPNADIYGGGAAIFAGWSSKGSYGLFSNQRNTFSGLNIFKNVSLGGSFSGRGAVHFDREGNALVNCNVWKNWSRSEGGGVFVDNDQCSLTDVTITDNYSETNGWSGGGVYVLGSVDLSLGGKCIIKNNSSSGKPKDDLLLAYNNTMNARLYPALSEGSQVWVAATSSMKDVVQVKGVYDDRMFWADEDDRHVEYKDSILKFVVDSEADLKIHKTGNSAYRAKKYPELKVDYLTPDSTAITAGSRTKKVNTYTSGNGNTYDVYQGVVEFPAFADPAKDLETTFFYSDGYFDRKPTSYDEHLATASMHLAVASFYSNDGNKGAPLYSTSGSEPDGTFYPVKSNNIRQFLSDIGVAEGDIYLNDYNIQKPGSFTIGVAIGSKKVKLGGKDKTLVIVGVRGAGYEQEWVSNMTLGSEGETKGFGSAADQVFGEINKYLKAKGIEGSSEDTLFWVAGYSRAGATSNLTGARIVDKYDANGARTFVYTFAAPQGGSSEVRDNSGSKYSCIHNVLNPCDLVPEVGPASMGFHRYGIDHYAPGGTSGSLKSSTGEYSAYRQGNGGLEKRSYTTWRDNDKYTVGSNEYNNQKNKMLAQLKAIAGYDIIFSDYFASATMSYLHSTMCSGFGAQLITESGSKWKNPADFNRFFLDDLMSKAVNFDNNKTYRYSYSKHAKYGLPFEQAAADAAGVVFALNGKQMEKLMELAGTLKSRVDMTGFYTKFLRGSRTAEAQAAEIWDALAKPTDEGRSKGYTYLQDEGLLTPSQFETLQKSMPTLLTVLLGYMKADYKETKNDVVGTLGYNVTRILMNHYPEVNLAWVRSFDSFYNGQTSMVKMTDNVKAKSVAAPKAVGSDGKPGTDVKVDGGKPAVALQVDGDVNSGASIYYRFIAGNDEDSKWHPYGGPIALAADQGGRPAEYKLEAYAIHDGKRSATSKVSVSVDDTNTFYYQIPADSAAGGVIRIAEGGHYSFEAPTKDMYVFKKWTWLTDRAAGEAGLSGLDMNARAANFTVSNLGTYGVRAEYFEKVNEVALALGEATADQLPSSASLVSVTTLTGGTKSKESVAVPVTWSKVEDGKYAATFKLSKSAADELYFVGRPTDYYFKSFDSALRATVAVNAANSGLTTASVETQASGLPGLAAGNLEVAAGSVKLVPAGDPQGWADSDGNATVKQEFTVEGYHEPDGMQTLLIAPRDINLVDADDRTQFSTGERFRELKYQKGSKVTMPIPTVTGEVFVGFGSNADAPSDARVENGMIEFTMPASRSVLILQYKPVVSEAIFVLDGAVEAGKSMPQFQGAVMEIENSWVITQGINAAWTPAAQTASYDTPYTLTLTLDKENLGGKQVVDEGASWSEISQAGMPQRLYGLFDFSADATFEVQDTEGVVLAESGVLRMDGAGNPVVTFAFAGTESAKAVEALEIEPVTVAHTKAPSASVLPRTVEVLLDDGTIGKVSAEWTLGSYEYSEQGYVVEARAKLTSKEYVLGDVDGLDGAILVEGLDTIDAPTASLVVGDVATSAKAGGSQFAFDAEGNPILDADGNPTYVDEVVTLGDGNDYSAKVALAAASGATIRYTVSTDGNEPADPGEESASYGGAFEIGWGNAANPDSGAKKVIVKARAFVPGKRASEVASFTYNLRAVPSFKTQSLVLSGRIGVNFFMGLPAIEGVDYSQSYMEFTVKGKTSRANFDPNKKSADGAYAGFTCHVNAIEMAEPITAVFHYGDGMTVEKTYSVKRYIETFESQAASFDAETVSLVKAIADFGHYAQIHLAKQKGWVIGKDYEEMDKFFTKSYDVEALKTATAKYVVSREVASDMAMMLYALSMEDEATLNVFFVPVKGYAGDITVTVDGLPAELKRQPDGVCYVQIPNIAAHQMGEKHTIVAKTTAGESKVDISALSYAQSRLADYSDDESHNVGAALYRYWEAAQAYKAKH